MYKLTIESDEAEDIELALQAREVLGTIWEIHNLARAQLKHGDETVASLDKTLEEIYELTLEYVR
jgi:hypothetical protein